MMVYALRALVSCSELGLGVGRGWGRGCGMNFALYFCNALTRTLGRFIRRSSRMDGTRARRFSRVCPFIGPSCLSFFHSPAFRSLFPCSIVDSQTHVPHRPLQPLDYLDSAGAGGGGVNGQGGAGGLQALPSGPAHQQPTSQGPEQGHG